MKIPRKLKKKLKEAGQTYTEFQEGKNALPSKYPMSYKDLQTYPKICIIANAQELDVQDVSIENLDLNDAFLIKKDTHYLYGRMSDVKIKDTLFSEALGRPVYNDYNISNALFVEL